MKPKYSLIFHEVQQPITQPVTKFGGQPTWITEPQWPLSRSTGEPMRFICQIALDSLIFGEISGRMAYLFITDGETFVDNTFDPDGGENAVIIQPGTCDVPTQPLSIGPSLYKMVNDFTEAKRVPLSCELAVELIPDEDPDLIVEDEEVQASEEAWAEFTKLWSESKIGGTPAFLQYPEYPAGVNWRLLLQLDSVNVPFSVNFGDAGVGYAFLSEDGMSGKFLWQCL
jgi:uncharacterized protein YwqG